MQYERKNVDTRLGLPSLETVVSLVVVSNRVAGAKAGEPISEGLAATLIPSCPARRAAWAVAALVSPRVAK